MLYSEGASETSCLKAVFVWFCFPKDPQRAAVGNMEFSVESSFLGHFVQFVPMMCVWKYCTHPQSCVRVPRSLRVCADICTHKRVTWIRLQRRTILRSKVWFCFETWYVYVCLPFLSRKRFLDGNDYFEKINYLGIIDIFDFDWIPFLQPSVK